MDNYLAQALMDIGKSLPGQLRQNRVDQQALKDKKRQYISDDLANELSQLQIQSAKNKLASDTEEQTRKKAGLEALADASRGMQRQKTFTDLNKLEEQAGIKPADYNILSNRDVFTNSGASNYGDQDAVKQFYKTNVEDPEKSTASQSAIEAKLSQKNEEMVLKEKLAQLKNEYSDRLNDERFENQRALLEERLKAISDEKEKDREADKTKNSLNPDEKLSNAENVIAKVDLITAHPGFKTRVGAKGLSSGFGLMKTPVAGTSAAGFDAEFNALKSMLTMENLGKMKGTLSDSDMKVLTQAASSLDINMPEKDFLREASRVKAVMQKVKSFSAAGSGDSVVKDPLGIR